MNVPRPGVMIGTPCYGGVVTHVYMHSLLELMGYAGRHEFSVGLWTTHSSLVPLARNNIVAGFLDSPAPTHLLFVDSDIAFKPEDVHRLLRFDQDFVAASYPIKNYDWARAQERPLQNGGPQQLGEAGLHFVGVPCRGGDQEVRDGFVTAERVGAGFMMLRRSAIERLVAAYPETKYKSAPTYPPALRTSDNQYDLFACGVDPDTGVYLTEDYAFCRRWRAIGGKIWLDMQTRLGHVGSHEFRGNPRF
jgi:hypothetical protein